MYVFGMRICRMIQDDSIMLKNKISNLLSQVEAFAI